MSRCISGMLAYVSQWSFMTALCLYTSIDVLALRKPCWAEISVFFMVRHDCTHPACTVPTEPEWTGQVKARPWALNYVHVRLKLAVRPPELAQDTRTRMFFEQATRTPAASISIRNSLCASGNKLIPQCNNSLVSDMSAAETLRPARTQRPSTQLSHSCACRQRQADASLYMCHMSACTCCREDGRGGTK